MKAWIWIIIIILVIIGIISLVSWGYSNNWGKSFNVEEVSLYCSNACSELNKEKYCARNLQVNFEDRSQWNNANCELLVMNNIINSCPDISCS